MSLLRCPSVKALSMLKSKRRNVWQMAVQLDYLEERPVNSVLEVWLGGWVDSLCCCLFCGCLFCLGLASINYPQFIRLPAQPSDRGIGMRTL